MCLTSTEWLACSKLRAEEVAVISEAIAILNDDDALGVFKKAGAFLLKTPVGTVGFLQASTQRRPSCRRRTR